MQNSIKNSKGFTLLDLCFVMTFFMALYFTAAFSIGLAQQKDYVRSTCVDEASSTQSGVLKTARVLFNLNKQSTSFRISIKSIEIAIIAAYSTDQLYLIPPLNLKLNNLKMAQNALDQVQRGLIYKMQFDLHKGHFALIAKINKDMYQNMSPWQEMIFMIAAFRPQNFPRLAIRADSEGGVAPNYEWENNAEHTQALAYSWNMFFRTKEDKQTLLSWMNTLQVECSVVPDVKEEKWHLKINVDKS